MFVHDPPLTIGHTMTMDMAASSRQVSTMAHTGRFPAIAVLVGAIR
jgi:hypothetical protein